MPVVPVLAHAINPLSTGGGSTASSSIIRTDVPRRLRIIAMVALWVAFFRPATPAASMPCPTLPAARCAVTAALSAAVPVSTGLDRFDAHGIADVDQRPAKPLAFLWPTTGHRVIEGYGERTNPRTGTVTVNPGITIGAEAGGAVCASAGGTVSRVSWLPGYGTIVIVQHRDRYRTVYGNLSTATVKRGQAVTAGQRLGSAAGPGVHFEVWRGRSRLNPLTVLPR